MSFSEGTLKTLVGTLKQSNLFRIPQTLSNAESVVDSVIDPKEVEEFKLFSGGVPHIITTVCSLDDQMQFPCLKSLVPRAPTISIEP